MILADIDLEQIVLGCLMDNKNTLEDFLDKLNIDIFYDDKNKAVFTSIQSLNTGNSAITLLTIKNEIVKLGFASIFEPNGIIYFLTGLTDRVVSTIGMDEHVLALKEFQVKRTAINSAKQLIKDCQNPTKDIFESLESFNRNNEFLFDQVVQKAETSQMDAVNKALKDFEIQISTTKGGISGVPSLLKELDEITGGWQKTDLIVLAARPAMGKSALALTFATNAASLGYPVAFISLEMSNNQLIYRQLSSITSVNLSKFKGAGYTEVDRERINSYIEEISQLPIIWDDSGKIGITELILKAKRFKKKYHTSLLIIDYLQILDEGQGASRMNRDRIIGDWTRKLKSLAKELEIPIIVLSQLSRNVTSRTDKKPLLSDLRESGSIEQDADMVLFVHRPDYYKEEEDELGNSTKGIAEIIIAKNRNGKTENLRVRFSKETASFKDLEDDFNSGF